MRAALVVALVVLAACPTGPSAGMLEPARGPHGIAADLRVTKPSARVRGELLMVEDSTLLVLSGNHVFEIPIRRVRGASFPRSGVSITSGTLRAQDRERLRLVSRYPAGLSPEARTRLLAAYPPP